MLYLFRDRASVVGDACAEQRSIRPPISSE
jgi:hypothetical protein